MSTQKNQYTRYNKYLYVILYAINTNYIKDAYLIKKILPLNSVSIGTKEIYASYAFNNIESH